MKYKTKDYNILSVLYKIILKANKNLFFFVDAIIIFFINAKKDSVYQPIYVPLGCFRDQTCGKQFSLMILASTEFCQSGKLSQKILNQLKFILPLFFKNWAKREDFFFVNQCKSLLSSYL